MLTQEDAQWIMENRSEIKQGRTETITLVREVAVDADTYTGEGTLSELPESVQVIWKEDGSRRVSGEVQYINGIKVEVNDVEVTFDIDTTLSNVLRIERDGLFYKIIAESERGIGASNRRECLVRRLT